MKVSLRAVALSVMFLSVIGDAVSQEMNAQGVSQVGKTALQIDQHRTAQSQRFGLSEHEWLRYEDVMASAVGWEMQDKHPLAVLGRTARDSAERQRYAKMLVRYEHEVAEGLLAFAKARQQAWHELYPNLPIIADAIPQRVSLFASSACETCSSLIQGWRSKGALVDIYFVGKRDDTELRRWAMSQGIRKQDVDDKRITLNHDNGNWLAIAKGQSLPVVMAETQGQWQAVSL